MTTITLNDGYGRAKDPKTFRPMTPEEAKQLGYNSPQIPFEDKHGTYRYCRVNGAPKTWKTRSDVELPVKYGLRDCARAVSHNGEMILPSGGRLLVPVE